jgi:hypothetical protein
MTEDIATLLEISDRLLAQVVNIIEPQLERCEADTRTCEICKQWRSIREHHMDVVELTSHLIGAFITPVQS